MVEYVIRYRNAANHGDAGWLPWGAKFASDIEARAYVRHLKETGWSYYEFIVDASERSDNYNH